MRYSFFAPIFLLISLMGFSLFADEQDPSSIRFSGIPALGFGPDSGFGFGVVGKMFVDQPGYSPYKMAVGAKVYLTTKGIHSHNLSFDGVNAFGLPLRLTSRIGFFSTIAQNYCGPASDAVCDENRAAIEADSLGLLGDERSTFINRYYKNRHMSIFGDVSTRWLLWKDQAKLELMLTYLGAYYLNRGFKERGPYKDSLFEKDFKGKKIDGYMSTLEVGLMLDKRDMEAAPTSGYWLESSIRGASWLWGSAWDYFGANAAARFYIPLDDQHLWVIASQSIADVILGDVPFSTISSIGGTAALNDMTAIGGQYVGRGIREQRYVGRFKLIEQLEMRYTFYSFNLWKQNFDLTGALMGDFAMTSWDFSRFKKDMGVVYTGFGGGLRINWNKTFIIRGDLGFSPHENFSPKLYIGVGNIF